MESAKFRLNNILFSICKKLFYTVILLTFFSCDTHRSLSKTESENYLKALNSDMVNMTDEASGRPEIKAIKFIWKQRTSPVPFKSDSSSNIFETKPYRFEDHLGVYVWDQHFNEFIKVRDTSLIYMLFPLPGDPTKNVVFRLQYFVAQKTNSRPDFPVSVSSSIVINQKQELEILHHAIISEGLLSGMETKINGNGYALSFNLNREGSMKEESGRITSRVRFSIGTDTILNSDLDADINYHPPTYSLQFIRLNQILFNTELSGTIDYGAINPTSKEYTKEFNKFCNMVLYTAKTTNKIGKVILSPVNNADQNDFYIEFNDGSTNCLSNYLLLLKKLLDLKY